MPLNGRKDDMRRLNQFDAKTQRRKDRTRFTQFFSSLRLCAFASILLNAAAQTPPKSPPPVEVQTIHATRGEITRSIVLPGRVLPYEQATLYAKVGGYLKSIRVDKGDRVKEGDLIAEIEVPELLADRAKQKVEIAVADRDYQRLLAAQQKAPDLITPQALDDAKGKWEITTANLERTDTFLKFAQVVAPFAGVITERFVDRGPPPPPAAPRAMRPW